MSNQDRASKIINDHMLLGNKYLDIFKDIRNLSTKDQTTDEQMLSILEKIKILDRQTSKLHISFMGRRWSEFKIKKEMDLSWIEK